MRRLAAAKSQREPTIALINIIFLLLVFFMVAGSFAPPIAPELTLVRTDQLEGLAPPDALVIHPDGRMEHQGMPVDDLVDFVAALPEADRSVLRLVPDRALPARTLVGIARSAMTAGVSQVMIVTERGLQ